MFIHIGEDHVIESHDVISIIDYELFSSSSIVEEMIMNQRNNQRVFESPNAEAKSIVITKDYIYFSPLSVLTLKKRANITTTLNKMEDFSDGFSE
ncbi:DUF370 domain-containing protein [Pontibacillus yanchengensis]|uniref:DUF370 domain-containing protein n=2 Tax=Pontibacillus yanchengensis TaxID=462910 RepID=A0ACC7VJD8_9BACI|nr:extracellular matrix/biofilm biosynthesis regulator RemA family protein [Pontibacillus yanchengensis]MYL34427.1 DUF370 domain-containing protein [Pontibacillus yanchengensis]MYL54235.1 DUF370 domain-containing protein [Pontibacillus yanchengensis]